MCLWHLVCQRYALLMPHRCFLIQSSWRKLAITTPKQAPVLGILRYISFMTMLASLVSTDSTTSRMESRKMRTKQLCWNWGCGVGILRAEDSKEPVHMEFYITWNIPILQLPMWKIDPHVKLPLKKQPLQKLLFLLYHLTLFPSSFLLLEVAPK